MRRHENEEKESKVILGFWQLDNVMFTDREKTIEGACCARVLNKLFSLGQLGLRCLLHMKEAEWDVCLQERDVGDRIWGLHSVYGKYLEQ